MVYSILAVPGYLINRILWALHGTKPLLTEPEDLKAEGGSKSFSLLSRSCISTCFWSDLVMARSGISYASLALALFPLAKNQKPAYMLHQIVC